MTWGALRPVRGVALAVVVVLVAVACETGRQDEPSAELAALAAPLVDAHAALEIQAALVEEDVETALERWPGVADTVTRALDAVPDPEGAALAARERATLVGYVRGLEVARDAWERAHEVLARGVDESARRAVVEANERMRHLDRLADGVGR